MLFTWVRVSNLIISHYIFIPTFQTFIFFDNKLTPDPEMDEEEQERAEYEEYMYQQQQQAVAAAGMGRRTMSF